MGDVEGNAVRPHHGSDDVDGEISVQGSGREEGRRQEIDEAGRVAALLLALASKSGGHAILILESERGE